MKLFKGECIPDDYCGAIRILLDRSHPAIANIYETVAPAMASAEEIAACAFPMTAEDRQAVEKLSRERGYRRIEVEWTRRL